MSIFRPQQISMKTWVSQKILEFGRRFLYKEKKNGVIRDDEWSFERTGMYQSRVHGHVPYFDQTELIQMTVNLLTRHHCLLLQEIFYDQIPGFSTKRNAVEYSQRSSKITVF